MKISIIVAMDKKRGIGKGNKLLWQIPQDMKRFKKLTTGHAVIMGRKTLESIGKVLPGRTNIIITHNSSFVIQDAIIVSSFKNALDKAKEVEKEEVFIIGGGQIYKQALPLADKLYLTIVEAEKEADTFFPDYSDFKKVVDKGGGEWERYKYRFEERER